MNRVSNAKLVIPHGRKQNRTCRYCKIVLLSRKAKWAHEREAHGRKPVAKYSATNYPL